MAAWRSGGISALPFKSALPPPLRQTARWLLCILSVLFLINSQKVKFHFCQSANKNHITGISNCLQIFFTVISLMSECRGTEDRFPFSVFTYQE
jgi:uncharacterized membrane protein